MRPKLLLSLTASLLALSLCAAPAVARAAPAGVCPGIPGTQNYTFVYGQVTVGGSPAPAGAVVMAVNPRGDNVGCIVVAEAGQYPLMYVYGEQTVAGNLVPGMRNGETVAFEVDGVSATADPALAWSNDWASHEVDLAAAANPYDLDNDGSVDVDDVQEIALAWQATDATSLAAYDFDGNGIVDIGDIVTVAAHWGE